MSTLPTSTRAALAALVLVVPAALLGPVWLQAPAGIALALILPGTALLGALRLGRDLDGPERALVVLGGSIAFDVLAGLALHLVGLSLTRTSWVVALAVVTVALGVAALGSPAQAGPRPRAMVGVRYWLVAASLPLLFFVVAIAVSAKSDSTTLADDEPRVVLTALRDSADPEQVTISVSARRDQIAGVLELDPEQGRTDEQSVTVDAGGTWSTSVQLPEDASMDITFIAGDLTRTVSVRAVPGATG